MIKYEYNEHSFARIFDYPYTVLSEQCGTFEVAAALQEFGVQVYLHRDYDVDDLIQGLLTVRAGLRLQPSEYDLKRFTSIYTSLPAGTVTGVYISDDYVDHADFIAFLKKFAKHYPAVHTTAGHFNTTTGALKAADHVDAVSVVDPSLATVLSPALHRRKKSIVYGRTADYQKLLHCDAGANAIDISAHLEGTVETAGAVISSGDSLVKKFRGDVYYQEHGVREAFDDVHAGLEQAIFRAGHTNLKDFVKFARTK